jgi:hypothetical protein
MLHFKQYRKTPVLRDVCRFMHHTRVNLQGMQVAYIPEAIAPSRVKVGRRSIMHSLQQEGKSIKPALTAIETCT